MNVYVRPISSTTPVVPSTSTRSPIRSGCVNAIRIPATKLASVRCAAKPSTSPRTADEARIAAGDRPDLRDHEQRGEDADQRRSRPRRCAAARGSASPPRARARAGPSAGRRAVRATSVDDDHDRGDDDDALPGVHRASYSTVARRSSERHERQAARRPAKPSSRPCQKPTSSSPRRQQRRTSSPPRERREVDEPRVEILHLHAERWISVDASRDSRAPPRRSRPAPRASSPGLEPAAVPRDRRRASSPARLERPARARGGARPSPRRAAAPPASAAFASSAVKYRSPRAASPVHHRRREHRSTVRDAPAAAPQPARRGAAEPGRRDLPLEPRRDLGGGALRLARLRAEPAPARGPLGRPRAYARPRAGSTDVWARWDSDWFLRIAEDGYGSAERRSAAFFPLYPAARRRARPGPRRPLRARRDRRLARRGLAAFVLLYRLAETRLGAEGARRAVLYLALFPMALFLQAVYSESLFLLLVVAASCSPSAGAGRRQGRRRPRAADAARGPRAPARARAARLAAPTGGAPSPRSRSRRRSSPSTRSCSGGDGRRVGLRARAGDLDRELSPLGPLGGVWDGLRAGWAGVRQLAPGRTRTSLARRPERDRCASPRSTSGLAFLVLFVAAHRRRLAPLRRAVRALLPRSAWRCR